MADEESFPRGGRIVRKRSPQENHALFSVTRPSKPKKQKQAKNKAKNHTVEEAFEPLLNIHGSLIYSTIQTGMIILGCVRNVKNFALEIELPGLCFASVSITEISDPFTKHLNQLLANNEADTKALLGKMFSIGDFLPVKIINIEAREKGIHVEGSINPREIYAENNHDSFKKQMLVWSSVGSQADHGYEMNMGVKNCRAFLPSKNIVQGEDYVIGRPLWCVVHKVDSTATASILRLSAKAENIRSAKLDIESIHEVIPGMRVEFVTDKVTAHGIQGKFADNFIGYVDENFLNTPLKRPTDYHEGKILIAYVLFVEHTSKITHLSLRFPEREAKPDLNVGDIVRAEVFCRANNGVFFALPNKLKGFTTNKRLLNTLGKKDNIKISEAINSKYPVGSSHQCRIMDYNYFTKTFVCTPEIEVVKQPAFAPKDLVPGQLVSVNVEAIKDEGIVVTTGHIRGFVPNLHISNTEYSSKVKQKFKEGQKVNARVLNVEGEKALFTLKPTLVDNEDCLTRIEEAEIGKKYHGVVCKLTETGALVVFYGNVKGWIRQKGMGHEKTDPSKYFFIGQVVHIYVWRIDDNAHIHLSLFRPQVKSSLPNVGGRYCGIVKSLNEHGINIQIENTQRKGFVPIAHLSQSLSLCAAIKNTYSPGDRMPELMYVGGIKPQIFSRREGLAMKMRTLPKLENLVVGNIIRCSYQSVSAEGIHVVPHIQDFTDSILIAKENIGKRVPELTDYQLLMAKIEELDRKNRKLSLSIKLSDVFDKGVEAVIDVFSQYLSELAYLYQYGKKHQWGICKYHPGDRVDGTVLKIGPQGGCVVSLPNDVKGIAVPSLCPKALKEGDQVAGVVIGRDYEKQFVDLCLKPDVSGKVNPVQDAALKGAITSSVAKKLLVKDECVVSVLQHSSGNKQLVYLPAKLHENDFEGCLSYYEDKTFKICVCGKLKKFLIGMSKRLFLHLDKAANKDRVVFNSAVDEKDDISKTKRKKAVKVKEAKVNDESDSGIEPEESNEVEVETESEDEAQPQPQDRVSEQASVALPGVSSFFSAHNKQDTVEESSSEDEDNGPTEKKKKKLSPAERAELLRQEEERISKIEKELADPTKAPESAEQFDRILLSKPNSAELWAKYVAFHIATTEIEKARAVARRALDTINMTMTDEKFKIWVVLLNLENMFGTKESFDKTFEEALKFNDSLQVYLKVIEMFAENAKYVEMEEKINKARIKHKQDPVMWLEVGKTYYLIGKPDEARQFRDRALKSITDKKSQMSIIVRFAIMEFKHGDPDQGCAVFETILTTEPKKVNIWSIYVDQLVKKGRIDEARQVLERSVCHDLPLKSMKSLFMKFRKFEEVHGTPESLEAVKQRAQDYVAKFGK